MELSEELLRQVKSDLDITWDDTETDKRIETIVKTAVASISHQIGVSSDYDFSAPGMDNTLVLSYCAYLWNKVELSLFYENYKEVILQSRAIHEVEKNQE